jgi:hypothetical protein
MYIVLENANTFSLLATKYLLLELDTLEINNGEVVRSFCVVDSEHIPLNEIPQIESKKQLHNELIENYRQQNWDQCGKAIEVLLGSFRGELDSFYIHLAQRIASLRNETLPETWNGVVPTAELRLPE